MYICIQAIPFHLFRRLLNLKKKQMLKCTAGSTWLKSQKIRPTESNANSFRQSVKGTPPPPPPRRILSLQVLNQITYRVYGTSPTQNMVSNPTLILHPKRFRYKQLNYVQIFLICKYLLYCYQYLIMTKFRLLIPKYIFVQYLFVLLRKFGLLIPKYIFVLCVYWLVIAVFILMEIYLQLQSE